jgi:hypothetical protein
MRYRAFKRVRADVTFSPEDRELIARRGEAFDPSSASDLRTLVLVAVEDKLNEWAEQEREEGHV